MFGPHAPIWRFLERLRACQHPPTARSAPRGLHLLEVFPALALPALEPEILKRKRAAAYNPANGRKFSHVDWLLVTGAVRRHADELGIGRLSHWAGQAAARNKPSKHDQDCLDAAICLIIALKWRRGPRDSVAVLGDRTTGYMVTPVSPETRQILEQAAAAKHVPIDVPWPEVERSRIMAMPRRGPAHDVESAVPAGGGMTRGRAARRRIVFDEKSLRTRLVTAARAGDTLTYGEVARQFGVRWSQGASTALTATLKLICKENLRRREPQLMALVVNRSSRMPGLGYFQTLGIGRTPQSELRVLHRRELTKIWTFAWPD